MAKDKISPELTGGFKDYLPEEMIPRQRIIDTIKTVFERFGFAPLETPCLEKEEVLTGGDPDFKKNIFRAGIEGGNERLALRFDLTVPLARIIALYPEIKKPFKRFQLGNAWRGEKPQAGRFREFLQFDADIVGSKSPLADAEIVSLICATMSELGIENFVVKINNRKILSGLPAYIGFDETKLPSVLRTIDKIERQGWEKAEIELAELEIGLNKEQIAAIKIFIDTKTLDEAEKLMSQSPVAIEGINELKQIASYLKSMKVPDDKWKIDFSVARGLGYYTGPVFETILTDLPIIGSVFSGGRYDNLVERFGQNQISATGASVGVDRLFVAMKELGLIKETQTISKVMVLNFDENCRDEALAIVSQLRDAGVASEIYLGGEQGLKEQLGYASSRQIPFVVIIGEEEKKNKTAKIKIMSSGEQIEIPQPEIASKIKSL